MLIPAEQPKALYPRCRPLRMLELVARYREVTLADVAEAIGMTESQLRERMAAEDGAIIRQAAWALSTPPWLLWFEIDDKTVDNTLRCCAGYPKAVGIMPAFAARYNRQKREQADQKAQQKMQAQVWTHDDSDAELIEQYQPEQYSIPAPGPAVDPEPVGPHWPDTRSYRTWHYDISKRDPKAKQKGLPPGYQFTNLAWSWDTPYIVWILKGWTLPMMLERGYLKYSTRSSTPPGWVHHNTKKKLAGAYKKK